MHPHIFIKAPVLALLAVALSPAGFGQAVADKDAQAQMKGLPPRVNPAEYQAQAKAGAVTIAAEFTAHAVPTPEAIYSTEEYVVVELALFGATDASLKLAQSEFSLRVNGKVLPADGFARTFPSLKDPEWEPPSSASKAGKTSIGNSGGGNQNDPPPSPPKMPLEMKRAMQQRVQKAALPEGDRTLPVAGLLFINYRGKADSIRTLELLYDGGAGKASLALHP
jgi:hypothetical protein